MAEQKQCSRCGADLPPGTPGGHCPQCLLKFGLSLAEEPVVSPAETQGAQSQIWANEKAGEPIGHYKLLRQIGEGGMGAVWLAEQEQPVRRKVALKIVKLGMDTKQVIARFEVERQALALMDHPNIARVFDAGATDTGRPFFVMELVEGTKITAFCDQHKMALPARLNLFIQVCKAVQHAHQKGVIHRDLKPSNILVIEQDGVPVPKVIDFGIAKAAADQPLTDQTLFTAFEQFLGTPAYMSPEQASLGRLDIDTRSDIYSLGVLLYELLAGQPPFDAADLKRAALDEILQTIREKDPPLPSAQLTTLAEKKLSAIAQCRQSEPRKLPHLVRGDLDWIVMKALDKDRNRRYDTANGLARDLERHLANEPVTARPPARLYLIQKAIRRHKGAVVAAAALAASLFLGLGVSSFLLYKEIQARATADDEAGQIRHQLYASHMNLAFQAWEHGDVSSVEHYLDEWRPGPGAGDERGFEWYFLWRTCHSVLLSLPTQKAPMRCVAFSPDGRLIATAGDDSSAQIRDSATGKLIHVFSNGQTNTAAVAFSPDGKTLATGSSDKTVRLWDAASGKPIAVLSGHKEGVTELAFFPGGKWLASATGRLGDGSSGNPVQRYLINSPAPAEIKIWDLAGKTIIKTLEAPQHSILSMAISPDGKRIAAAGTGNRVDLWDVDTGKMETNTFENPNGIRAVAFSPDGQSLAVGCGSPYVTRGELMLLDATTLKERLVFQGHEGAIFSVRFSPDGKWLASAGMDQMVKIWDTHTAEEMQSIRGHNSAICSLGFDPAGKRLATASWDDTTKIWDLEHPQGGMKNPRAGSYSSCFSPDGKLFVTGGSEVALFEVGSHKPPTVISNYIANDVLVAFSPDGSTLAAAANNGVITIWDARSLRRLAVIPGGRQGIWSIAFSPDSRTLASCDRFVNVRLWDVAARRQRAVFHPVKGPHTNRLFFSPDGRTLIVAPSGQLYLLDAQTGKEEGYLKAVSRCLGVSPDGQWLAIVRGPNLELVDIKTLKPNWGTNAHQDKTWAGCFSPDGKTLATASWDGTARLWNVATGQEMFTYRASGVVWCVSFSKDGKWWAVGSGEGEQVLFRAATPAEVASQSSQ